MTLDDLRAWGANVDEGLGRCMGMESFYLGLVAKTQGDATFDALNDALAAEDWKKAFEAAHALKGVLGNLSLTPLFDPANELCELLRPQEPVDYQPLLDTINERLAQFKAL